MKKTLMFIFLVINFSCSSKGSDDASLDDELPPEGSSWVSSCTRSSGGNIYIENMFVFYKGGIDQNSAIYADENCTEYFGSTDGFDNILELSYSEYSKVVSESGYEVVWFNSSMEDFFSGDRLKFEIGVYFDGNVMHKVRKDEDTYVVDFTNSFNRQL